MPKQTYFPSNPIRPLSRPAILGILTCLALTFTGCGTHSDSATGPRRDTVSRFNISGMHCEGCAGGLKSELAATPGVHKATVSFPKHLATVAHDPALADTAALIKVIEASGFKAQRLER